MSGAVLTGDAVFTSGVRRWSWFCGRIVLAVYGLLIVVLLFLENSLLYPAPKFPEGV